MVDLGSNLSSIIKSKVLSGQDIKVIFGNFDPIPGSFHSFFENQIFVTIFSAYAYSSFHLSGVGK